MSPTRVMLADDHNLVRAGVRKILEGITTIDEVLKATKRDEVATTAAV